MPQTLPDTTKRAVPAKTRLADSPKTSKGHPCESRIRRTYAPAHRQGRRSSRLAACVSIDLIVEVLDHAPDTLTSGERLVLIVIAEWANDKTREARQSHNWDLDTICRRAGIKRSGLKSVLQGLARKGLEVRVPAKVKDGKPIYAYEGKAVTFRVPILNQRGGHSIPTQAARGDATASERGGHSIQEGMPQPPPSPQGSPLKKNPSSLSPREASIPVQPAIADRERDESSSQEEAEPLTLTQKLIAKHGARTLDEIQFVEGHIDITCNVQSPGFYITADANGTLALHVAEGMRAYNNDAYIEQLNIQKRSSTRQAMSPADQRVAEGAVLYAKYRAEELGVTGIGS